MSPALNRARARRSTVAEAVDDLARQPARRLRAQHVGEPGPDRVRPPRAARPRSAAAAARPPAPPPVRARCASSTRRGARSRRRSAPSGRRSRCARSAPPCGFAWPSTRLPMPYCAAGSGRCAPPRRPARSPRCPGARRSRRGCAAAPPRPPVDREAAVGAPRRRRCAGRRSAATIATTAGVMAPPASRGGACASRCRCQPALGQLVAVGSSNIVSSVDGNRPPMMTIANGRCVSEPMLCDSAAGRRPDRRRQRRHQHRPQPLATPRASTLLAARARAPPARAACS